MQDRRDRMAVIGAGLVGLGMPKALKEHHPTLNSELLHYVKHGHITRRPDKIRRDAPPLAWPDGALTVY